MDVTVQITSDHELSLAEFLDGCAKVANETTRYHSYITLALLCLL